MASPKELHPGQRPGESLWDYLVRKRWEESQMRKLGISPSSYGLGSQEPTITDTVPERTKEKTVITQVDDVAVPDKVVTTIEQAPSVTSDAEATSTTEQASPVISNAEAAERGFEPRQREDGSWWWWDKVKNTFVSLMQQEGGLDRKGVGDLILGENLKPTEAITGVVEDIGSLFDTTAEHEARLRQREFEQQGPMQDYQGALAGLMQPPEAVDQGQLPGSAAPSFISDSGGVEGQFIQRMPPPRMPEGFMTPAREQEVVEQAEEDRIWGSYKYDVGSARKQYETDMAEIYKKAMQLSMFDIDPSAFVTLATKRMEQTSTFDEQERLQKIQRGLYYTKAGKWDPPSSKRVAFNRAKKFGAGVKLASAISNYDPGKEKAKEFVNWFNAKTGESTYLEKGQQPKGGVKAGWQKGTLSQGQGRAGTFPEVLVNSVRTILYNTSGGIQGRFDAAVREHMAHQKPDPQLGYNVDRIRRSAENWVIHSIMSPELLEAYTYTPSEGEEITDELIDALRKQGYIAIMTPEGLQYMVTGIGEK